MIVKHKNNNENKVIIIFLNKNDKNNIHYINTQPKTNNSTNINTIMNKNTTLIYL